MNIIWFNSIKNIYYQLKTVFMNIIKLRQFILLDYISSKHLIFILKPFGKFVMGKLNAPVFKKCFCFISYNI